MDLPIDPNLISYFLNPEHQTALGVVVAAGGASGYGAWRLLRLVLAIVGAFRKHGLLGAFRAVWAVLRLRRSSPLADDEAAPEPIHDGGIPEPAPLTLTGAFRALDGKLDRRLDKLEQVVHSTGALTVAEAKIHADAVTIALVEIQRASDNIAALDDLYAQARGKIDRAVASAVREISSFRATQCGDPSLMGPQLPASESPEAVMSIDTPPATDKP